MLTCAAASLRADNAYDNLDAAIEVVHLVEGAALQPLMDGERALLRLAGSANDDQLDAGRLAHRANRREMPANRFGALRGYGQDDVAPGLAQRHRQRYGADSGLDVEAVRRQGGRKHAGFHGGTSLSGHAAEDIVDNIAKSVRPASIISLAEGGLYL